MLVFIQRKDRQVQVERNDVSLTGAALPSTTSVLLCDDTPNIREFLRTEVSQHADLTVVGEAANGVEAIEQAQRLQPDVTILDIGMPLLDGLEALPRILEVSPETKVVAFSGLDRAQTEALARARGAVAFIAKGGSLKEVVSTIREVRETGRNTQADPLSRRNAQQLFALSLDLLCVARLDGYFEHLSPSWERTLGWTTEQLKERPFADFVHPEDREKTAAEVKTLAAGGETLSFENRYACADGSYRWLSWHCTLGEERRIYGSARDITEQKRLAATRDALASIVDYAFDAIIAVDLDGVITGWNAAAENMYGYSADQMLGQNIATVVTDRDELMDLLARARMGEVSRYETTRRTKSGQTLDVWITASPLRDEDGCVVGSSNITMDISERKRAERETETLQAELEDRVEQRTEELTEKTKQLEDKTEELQESMRELDAFAYTVSHDLRAPLRAMDGFSRILLDDYVHAVGPDAARYLGFIRSNAQGMQELVDGLLAFSRLGRRSLERVRLSPAVLARQALSDLGTAGEGDDLEIVIDEGLPECSADPTLLKQVFVNLIGNAIKFSRSTPNARVYVGFRSEADTTVYFVSDNGVGFEPEYAEKVFGVFQRLHRAEEFEGTGIGLANVLRIVTKHDGRVWCEAKPGEGATFFFTIGTEGE